MHAPARESGQEGVVLRGRTAAEIAVLPADLQQLHPVRLNFARRLELIGLEFDQEYDRLVLRLRWKLLAAIPCRLHCFAHVMDPAGGKIDAMDHELLAGSPPLSEWRPGDEAAERLSLQLPSPRPVELQLRIGLYDPVSNLRWPIWASTLPVGDEHSAGALTLGQIPSTVPLYQFPEAQFEPCQVKFEKGVELSGYSIGRVGSSVWLQLFWVFERRPNPHWRFFGHGVMDRSPTSAILASFDQDLQQSWPSGSQRWEQNIARNLGTGEAQPAEIAAGVFHTRSGRRLRPLVSTLSSDPATRRIFLPLRAGGNR